MSGTVSWSPSLRSLDPKVSPFARQNISCQISYSSVPLSKSIRFPEKIRVIGVEIRALDGRNGGSLKELDDSPVSIELQPICSESQFDRLIAEAQQLDESIVIVWMAEWCRKCIYLKPKLEKLAAEYYPRLRFYRVDVNSVPYKLVSRAGVTKMPTIQLWGDGKKQSEVLGGQKAHFVVKEVREMIENDST